MGGVGEAGEGVRRKESSESGEYKPLERVWSFLECLFGVSADNMPPRTGY